MIGFALYCKKKKNNDETVKFFFAVEIMGEWL